VSVGLATMLGCGPGESPRQVRSPFPQVGGLSPGVQEPVPLATHKPAPV